MPEFTASDPGSSFPNQNILFNSASGLTGQELQKNQLALQGQQLDLTAADHEQVGRLAAGLLNEPDLGKRAELYSRGVGMLQAQNLAKYAPPTLPDESTLRSLVNQSVPAQTQAEWLQNLTANKAYTNAGNTASTASPGTTTGAAAPSSVPIPARGTGGPGASASAPPEWLPYYEEASKETGIPVDLLIAQTRQESGFNPNAKGAAGEVGLFQIKPSTASSPGFGLPPVDPASITGPDNVRNNILFGARYLKARMGGGDPSNPAVQAAGLHAYNGGGDPNYVQNVFRYRPTLAPSDPNAAVTAYTPPTAGATTATAAPAGGGGTPGSYQVASTAPVPPPGSTAAPGTPPAAAPAPGATTAAAPTQPQATPAGGPAPPQLQPVNANGLTDVQQRQVNALAANPQTTLPQRMAAEQAFRNQNIQLQQKQFSDWVQVQQLQTSQGQLSVSQQNSALEYWKAAHPDAKVTMTGGEIITQDPRTGQEIAPRIQVTPQRADTAAMAIVSRLGPKVANGTATPEEQAQYAVAVNSYRQPVLRENPVTKETVRVNTRELPAGFPEPPSLGGGGAPGGAGAAGGANVVMPGLSPAQQQVERDPAAYKVSESQYDRDSKEIAGIADAGRSAQADQIRINEMQDVLQRFSSGPGTDARTAAASFLQRWLPAAVTGWEKQSANLSGAEAAQAFSKLALAGAGSAERSVLGNRGGFQAVKMFQAANPNIDLQDATNKSILDMQLISNQANQDYSQGAQAHFAENKRSFGGPTHQYKSLAQFDTAWNAQRNPQVFAAAMGAIGGQPASQWTKGLSDAEYARALQIVQRAKPSAVVQTKNGPYSMQPNAVTTGSTAPPGTKVMRFDHNGNQIQ